mmetsp:Transcript_25141/g.82985  ORF Transcript_25141/g.82985 Transcript_25141/m.82985 type:complete len:404 (+) Transcript_25141:86-1297(+)
MSESQDMEGKYRSIYPVIDEPVGTSVPFFPQVATQDSKPKVPMLGQGQDPSKRLDLSMSEADAKALMQGSHPAMKRPDITSLVRPTASITEIPGAPSAAKRLSGATSLRDAAKPIENGAVQRQALDSIVSPLTNKEDTSDRFSFPAVVSFAIGWIFPPMWLCGLRSLSSANRTSRLLGAASLFLLVLYCTLALVLFAKYYWPDDWSGNDPSCVQFTQGQQDFTSNPNGSALAIQTLPATSAVIPNITLYTVNCAYVTQTQISADTSTYKNRSFVVRALFPTTLGDDFGLYVRDIGSPISTSSASSPARAWFQYSNPAVSNPYKVGSPNYGSRPPCLSAMCNGVYEAPAFAKQGSKYVATVSLGWYQYQMAIGMYAITKNALERSFCIDTCLIDNIPDPNNPSK